MTAVQMGHQADNLHKRLLPFTEILPHSIYSCVIVIGTKGRNLPEISIFRLFCVTRHGQDVGKKIDNQLFALLKVIQGAAFLKDLQSAGGGMGYEV